MAPGRVECARDGRRGRAVRVRAGVPGPHRPVPGRRSGHAHRHRAAAPVGRRPGLEEAARSAHLPSTDRGRLRQGHDAAPGQPRQHVAQGAMLDPQLGPTCAPPTDPNLQAVGMSIHLYLRGVCEGHSQPLYQKFDLNASPYRPARLWCAHIKSQAVRHLSPEHVGALYPASALLTLL